MKINRIVLVGTVVALISPSAFANSFSGIYQIVLCKGQLYAQNFKQASQTAPPPTVEVSADQNQFVIRVTGSNALLGSYNVGRHLATSPSGGFVLTNGIYNQNGNLFRYYNGNSQSGSFLISETFTAKIVGNDLYLSDIRGPTDQSVTCLLNRSE